MSHKTILSTLTALCMASSLFALDEYMPVPARVMQINVGVERTAISGQYLDSWETGGSEDPDNPTALPMQGKFGLLDKLEASMAISYLILDSTGKTGLDRPVLALKYGDPVSGGGGFLAISLPVGFEDIMNAGNYATMTFGGMFVKDFPRVKVFSNASYSFNTEDNDKNKIDNLRFFGKPEYPLPLKGLSARNQYLGLNMAVTYDFYFNRMSNGESLDDGAHLFQVAPGAFYSFNKLVSAEMAFPLSLAGQNQAETRGFRLELFFTLDEGLYNSL
ncbi:MAG: hypothetical protein M3Y08_18420 [Fibrobacterota bacterium]|nr:hypothetical protein [Fibrobacterota bacterium]